MTVANPKTSPLDGYAQAPQLGLVHVSGADAANFLHNQTTQDIKTLGVAQARIAALCSSRGRIQASFIAYGAPTGDGVMLVTLADASALLINALRPFVLRSKVSFAEQSAAHELVGLAGPTLTQRFGETQAPWTLMRPSPEQVLVWLYPAQETPRALWIRPKPQPASAPEHLSPSLSQQQWAWSDAMSGVALVGLANADTLVPQMLNYESVGGIHFGKGCYPGQEVVARAQFRGAVKRRGHIIHSQAPLEPGDPLFHQTTADQACGAVIQAGPNPDGSGWNGFASLHNDATLGGHLSARYPNGPSVTLLPNLPYPIRHDI